MDENEVLTLKDPDVDDYNEDISDEALAQLWNDDDDSAEDSGDSEEKTPAEQYEADQLNTDEQEDDPADEKTEDTDKEEKAVETFTLKHMDEVKSVGKDEVVALAQKGLDYDRIRTERDELKAAQASDAAAVSLIKELAEQQGKTPQELVDSTRAILLARKEGITDEQAAERIKAQRETKPTEEKQPDKPPEKTPEQLATEKREAEVKEFLGEYGLQFDVSKIPPEVWADVAKGKSLLVAYMSWENKTLKTQTASKEKAASNKAKSTGSRSSSGNSNRQRDEITDDWYSS